jgi:hypothetical protein
MVIHYVRKPTNFVLNVYSGGCCSEYLATAVFVEQVDSLFDSFNGGTRVDQAKTLRCPLSDNSPHIEHWKKASMGVNRASSRMVNLPFFILLLHRMGG